jgi:hypothetical protein
MMSPPYDQILATPLRGQGVPACVRCRCGSRTVGAACPRRDPPPWGGRGRRRAVAAGPRRDSPRVSPAASPGSASMGRPGAAAARAQLALAEIRVGSRQRPPWDPPPSPSPFGGNTGEYKRKEIERPVVIEGAAESIVGPMLCNK